MLKNLTYTNKLDKINILTRPQTKELIEKK